MPWASENREDLPEGSMGVVHSEHPGSAGCFHALHARTSGLEGLGIALAEKDTRKIWAWFDPPADLGRRALHHDAPTHQDRHTVGQALRFGQVVGGEENGGALLVDRPDPRAKISGAGYVQPGRGLVKEQDIRIVNQRGCDGHSPLHAPG